MCFYLLLNVTARLTVVDFHSHPNHVDEVFCVGDSFHNWHDVLAAVLIIIIRRRNPHSIVSNKPRDAAVRINNKRRTVVQ